MVSRAKRAELGKTAVFPCPLRGAEQGFFEEKTVEAIFVVEFFRI